MKFEMRPFGTTKDGRLVTAFIMENDSGMRAEILDYGCTIRSLMVPDSAGRLVDVVLGYNTLAEYEENGGYLGAVVGRVGNRIGGGCFTLGGKEYTLAVNDRGNHLHGGLCGFDKKVWQGKRNGDELVMSLCSPDGEEGYPGTLCATVRYRLDENNTLRITYDAVSDRDTLVNLTNHAYFNLAGGGTILGHELQVFADRFLEADENCLPTGRLMPVGDTPFDFREGKEIGQDISVACEQLRRGNGYDHNFCLSDKGDWKRAAVLFCRETAIRMTCMTTQPGVQVYSANGLSDRDGKNGRMGVRQGLCLETQVWPDAIHHADFPSSVLPAGEELHTQTAYQFSIA
ncbi:MAG: galactose mutarotase [Clostridiales bacterium]|nr:galactose mutarotase [Clostridiales bacterium]